ncbi:hypothetical protein OUZ56_031921 [Daphnia magna]|uniref:Uncharacterized protein n=1 Tax=Daphnia magna TaxID=35525 RepID=A0ABQ9ZVZ3_9CRUS|nr:hypothetical protein OUZ56_031921 [Daphnia magna]
METGKTIRLQNGGGKKSMERLTVIFTRFKRPLPTIAHLYSLFVQFKRLTEVNRLEKIRPNE